MKREILAIVDGTSHGPLVQDVVTRVVYPCNCGRILQAGGIDYQHGIGPIDSEAVKAAMAKLRQLGIPTPEDLR